ncbi:MAG: hypothetical protein AAF492_02940 [Verrucomicrobiota bacterium]
MKKTITLLVLAFGLSAFGFNPSSIPRHQKNAPEQLLIDVTKVEKKKVQKHDMPHLEMTIHARVKKVTRSDSGLKPGKTFYVKGTWPAGSGAFGGIPAPDVEKGSYKAYRMVDKNDPKGYIPAAYTGSFVSTKKKK